MIFVTLGTQDKEFKRLLVSIEEYAKEYDEEVVVQAGYTKYESSILKIYDFLSQEEFEKYMSEADIVVTHAGVGSILTALKYGKPIVSAARSVEYKEHTNDHQKEILGRFDDEGYVIALQDFTKMKEAIQHARVMQVKEYDSNNANFVSKMKAYIDNIK